MKKLLLAFITLLSLTSCSLYNEQKVKTPLYWCLSEVAQNTVSIDEHFDYTYTELNSISKEEQEGIVKGYLITTYCYEENYNDFVKTEWLCGIGFDDYYGYYGWKVVHINDIKWFDCDVIEKTICNEGEL